MLIQSGSRLVMIGDSITDANRDKPTGEGLFDAYGKGYVNLVNAQLGAVYPGEKIRVINMGLSGNTVRDLENRWAADVVGRRPDWLSVMIGINDVWRQFDTPLQAEWHVKIGEYEATLDKLCGSTRASLKGLVLMTPYFIEPNRTDPMRAMMDEYGAVVKKLAAKHDAVFVDTQTAFDEVLKKLHPVALAWDRIHPNTVGHAVIARAFLKAVGFEW